MHPMIIADKREKKIVDEDKLEEEPFCCLGLQVLGWVFLACLLVFLTFFCIFGPPK